MLFTVNLNYRFIINIVLVSLGLLQRLASRAERWRLLHHRHLLLHVSGVVLVVILLLDVSLLVLDLREALLQRGLLRGARTD